MDCQLLVTRLGSPKTSEVEGIGWMDLMDLMDSDVEHKSENTEKKYIINKQVLQNTSPKVMKQLH